MPLIPMVYTFNSCPRENYKMGENSSQHTVSFWDSRRQDHHLSLRPVVGCFVFWIFRLKPNFWLWISINCALHWVQCVPKTQSPPHWHNFSKNITPPNPSQTFPLTWDNNLLWVYGDLIQSATDLREFIHSYVLKANSFDLKGSQWLSIGFFYFLLQ